MSGNVYSFLDVNAAIAGPGGAFSLAEGGIAEEGITIAQAGDKSGMQIGADGDGQHSLYADKSGQITLRLLKTSPINQKLMALYNFQTASSSSHGQNTLVINDASRGDVVTCQQVAFKKPPDLVYAKEAGMNEWLFDAIKIERTLSA